MDKTSAAEKIAALLAAVRPDSDHAKKLCAKLQRRGIGDAEHALGEVFTLLRGTKKPPAEIAALACSALERGGFRPVLAVGERDAAAGVWLYEASLLEALSGDAEAVGTLCAAHNLLFFDGEERSPAAFRSKLKAGKYSRFLDIPLARRRVAPPALRPRDPFAAWENALLDFSAKNPLVDFTGKGAIGFSCADADGMFAALYAGKLRLSFEEEERDGSLRVWGEEGTARALFKRGKEAEEETGARGLCLTFGLLFYPAKGGMRRAPAVLLPVRMERERGTGDFYLCGAEEILLNHTLFELLSREYGFPTPEKTGVRDLFDEIETSIRGRKNWDFKEENFLGAFSFPRYAQWHDLHKNAEKFRRHPILSALLKGTSLRAPMPALPGEGKLFLPLPSDSSQERAAALAAAGGSFVLHGPPGTGKSQTIANIISDALARGERVLFVSEKQAAADVVKSRLDAVGIGEFCLLMHAGRTRADILRDLKSYFHAEGRETSSSSTERYLALAEEIEAPFRALHAKKEGGMSAIEGIGRYLSRLGAADLVECGSDFTPPRIAAVGDRLRALWAAKEGGAADPLRDVGLTVFTPKIRERAMRAAEGYLAQLRHLKAMFSLLARAFGQRRSASLPAAESFARLAGDVARESLFSGADAEEFSRFLRGSRELDAASKRAENSEKTAPRSRFSPRRELLAEVKRLKSELSSSPLAPRFLSRGRRRARTERVYRLLARGEALFPAFDETAFLAGCISAAEGALDPLILGLREAAEQTERARAFYLGATDSPVREETAEEALLAVGAFLENIDLLPARCAYADALRTLEEEGIRLLPGAEKGTAAEIVASFEKSACGNFVRAKLKEGGILPEAEGAHEVRAAEFAEAEEEVRRETCLRIRAALCRSLPPEGERASLLAAVERAERERGSLRELLLSLSRTHALPPCVLTSPAMLARNFSAEEKFDLVVFDEASQITAAEAAGAIARGERIVVAGDPKQLPPTSFFRSGTENSVLDDLLALGMTECRLSWHYRSRHESLIAFSNAAYYDNRLCTLPSPARESRVKFVYAGGVYGRGGSKCNEIEAAAVAEEVISRLKSHGKKFSMGIVTFSDVQREKIEDILARRLREEDLEDLAYGGREPLFCKNLENVQGDERDVILFSVCYGPDGNGRIAMNFGPLNRADGWRRLNVALSRAREEMLVFSSVRAGEIGKVSGGAGDLKKFLRYAERGEDALERPVSAEDQIAKFVAERLSRLGFECRVGVGASACKIDVGVLDGGKYVLGIVCGDGRFTVKEREILLPQMLAAGGWNLFFLDPIRLFFNPEREIKRIKERLDPLIGKPSKPRWLERCGVPYRAVRTRSVEALSFLTGGGSDGEIAARLKRIVSVEQPISRAFLRKRCMQSFGVRGGGGRAEARLDSLIDGCGFSREIAAGREYFFTDPRATGLGRVRLEGGRRRRETGEDFTAYEILSLLRGALEEKVTVFEDEACAIAAEVCGVHGESFLSFVRDCIAYGEERGVLFRSSSGALSLPRPS